MAGLAIDILGFVILVRGAIAVAHRTKNLWKHDRHADLLEHAAGKPSDIPDLQQAHENALRAKAAEERGHADKLTVSGVEKEVGALKAGAILVSIGFVLQIIGAWPCP